MTSTYNYSVSPIPYNSGTIEATFAGGMAYLGGQRFVRIFQQNSPNMIMLSVIDYPNAMNVTPNVPTQTTSVLFTNDKFQQWFMMPLTTTVTPCTSFILIINTVNNTMTRMYPITINSDNTVSVGTVFSDPGGVFTNNGYYGAFYYANTTLLSDNKFAMYGCSSPSTAFCITYNPTTGTFSTINQGNYQFGISGARDGNNAFSDPFTMSTPVSFKTIPGSNKYLAIDNGNTITSNVTTPTFMLLDPTNNSTFNNPKMLYSQSVSSSGIGTTSQTGKNSDLFLPLSETRILNFRDSGRFRIIDSTSTFSPQTPSSATPATVSRCSNWLQFSTYTTPFEWSTLAQSGDRNYCNSFAIDNDYFALVWRNSATATMASIKIGRIVDTTFADCSSATNKAYTGPGGTAGATSDGLYINLPFGRKLIQVSPTVYMTFLTATTFRFFYL